MRSIIVKFLACVGTVPLVVYLAPILLAQYAPQIPLGVTAESYTYAAIAGGILGVIYIVLRPAAKLVLGIFNLFTLGILYIVLDAWLVQLCSWLMKDMFHVASFWWALVISVCVNVVRAIFGSIFGK